MININDRPQWLTIKNGSKTYVDQIIKKLNGSIILNANIQSIIKNGKKCIVQTKKKNYSFDHVFFACHADQALKLIKTRAKYKKILLVKSVTQLQGEDIGFLPGDLKEKLDPYMISFIDNFEKRMNLMNKYGINIDNQKTTNNKGMGVMGIRQLRSLKKEIYKINKNAEKQLANIFTKEQMNIYKLFQEEQRDEIKEQLIGRKNS